MCVLALSALMLLSAYISTGLDTVFRRKKFITPPM